jgi:hypothetical protein
MHERWASMKTYRRKHDPVEALRWTDTDENRELFAAWFEKHGTVFETRGPVAVLPEGEEASEGAWIIYDDHDEEFIAMDDARFMDTYEEVP